MPLDSNLRSSRATTSPSLSCVWYGGFLGREVIDAAADNHLHPAAQREEEDTVETVRVRVELRIEAEGEARIGDEAERLVELRRVLRLWYVYPMPSHGIGMNSIRNVPLVPPSSTVPVGRRESVVRRV